MPSDANDKETITVRVNVEIHPQALESIVQNIRNMAGKDENGRCQVDTADAVGAMISRFLGEKDFTGFVKNPKNYEGSVLE